MRLALSLLALLGLHDTLAMKQSWAFEGEDRSHFLIERFGFGPVGEWTTNCGDGGASRRCGLLPHGRYVQEWSHRFFISGRRATSSCVLDHEFVVPGCSSSMGKCLATHREYVQRVHWLMALLVTVKTLALFAEAMRSYYMKRNGDTLTAWTAVAYAFLSLKGLLLFSVLMLIGTGWSLLKPHLSQRDKSVLSLVLVLQVVSNIAQILESETAVGTRAWVSWRDVLILADVACCAAVLLPIVWSIRELRVAATTDGKAFYNLQKLTQFRSFYLLVITYIYVTRLVLQLLQASLPYDATWIAVAVNELAALGFFTVTGYRFRPLPLNPYLEVPMHEDDLEEFALDDDEDLDFRTIQRTDLRKFAYGAPVKTKASYSTKSTSSLDRSSNAKKRSGSVNSDL
ncbi:Lung seven transmembrane receptor-like [Phytophthora cactorum]|nr:Lung seven transmembrane receptor-like [Phytophthora cactorum]